MSKYYLTVITIALVLAASLALSLAQDMSIVYINSERLRTEYSAFIDAQNKFDSEVAVWEEEATALEGELIDLQKEYEQQALLLSEDKKKEKQRLIEQKQEEYQNYLSNVFGRGGQAEKRNTELTSPLLDKINTVLEEISLKNGYSVVLDAGSGAIAYADENLDITDLILEKLNTGE
ncbi:OmpH family outer membrane protein [bacterium]|nr:OmpH family outer membrane protein [bacterium]